MAGSVGAGGPVVCPRCGQVDMVVRVTSPQAPRVLPVTDAEIAQAAQQLHPAPLGPGQPLMTATLPARRLGPSGCLVAFLILAGIALFLGGAIYGVYHPTCPSGGVLSKNYPVSGLPVFVNPKCVNGDQVYEPVQEYVNPGGGVVGPVGQWVGIGLVAWGCIWPVVGFFRRRAERDRLSAAWQPVPQQAPAAQESAETLIARARGRVYAAYYCSRDDGFFFPGHPHFYQRVDWLHFLFD